MFVQDKSENNASNFHFAGHPDLRLETFRNVPRSFSKSYQSYLSTKGQGPVFGAIEQHTVQYASGGMLGRDARNTTVQLGRTTIRDVVF